MKAKLNEEEKTYNSIEEYIHEWYDILSGPLPRPPGVGLDPGLLPAPKSQPP